jgi:hypothetical protein
LYAPVNWCIFLPDAQARHLAGSQSPAIILTSIDTRVLRAISGASAFLPQESQTVLASGEFSIPKLSGNLFRICSRQAGFADATTSKKLTQQQPHTTPDMLAVKETEV